MHQGDFSYDGTSTWINNINNTLGSNFPYLGSVGNHDTWSQYAPFFRDRLSAMGLDPNVINSSDSNYAVSYKGLKMVFNKEKGDQTFSLNQLKNDNHIWKICSWHHNRNDFQAGGKGNSVALQTYRNCLDYGAIIATGHEHSYSRTCTLTDPGTWSASNRYGAQCSNPALMQVGPNSSFIFVSAMGGAGIRDYHASEHDDDGWWSTIYTSNRYCKNTCTKSDLSGQDKSRDISSYSYKWGALFITFNDGNPNRATGYFKNINGTIIDEFVITKGGGASPTPPPSTPTPTPSGKIPGDIDKDGDVDIFDYNLIIQHFGNTSCGNVADINGNCKVDIFDYNTLIENFGKKG